MKTTTLLCGATAIVLALAGCSAATSSATEDFPAANTTIDWIVPSAAGAGNDILARVVAPVMQEELGATINVVNVEGGNQVIGLNQLATAKPDGKTMGFTNIPSILGRYLDPSNSAGFDRESFIPIGSFASNDVIIAVPADSEYTTIGELLGAVEKNPGAISFATDSRGGDDHVNLRILEEDLGLDFNIVHYNSGADKVSATVSGEVQASLGGVSSFYGQYKSGDVRILAVISDDANPFIPDVPTLESAGYKTDPMNSSFTVSVPAGTPDNVVSSLSAALKAAATDDKVVASLEGAATEATWMSGDDAAALWQEREKTVKPIIDEILTEQP